MNRRIKIAITIATVIMLFISFSCIVAARNLGFWWYDTPRTVYVYTGDINSTQRSAASACNECLERCKNT